MGEHPDLAELEAVRTGEGRAEHALHLRGCQDCQREMVAIEELARSLSLLADSPLAVPADLDARILWNARKQAARARRVSRRWPRRASWAAAAAVVFVAGVTLRSLREHEPALVPQQPVGRMARVVGHDVDGDGRVDILDAFAMARALKRQSGNGADINGDGVVDRLDVDSMARRAVALAQG